MPSNGLAQGARYKIFGPFPISFSRDQDPRISLNEFWQQRVTDSPKGLSAAVGVYVWTHVRNGKKIPWNVGLTNKQGFKGRFVQKKNGFLQLLLKEQATDIEVFLIARLTPSGKFRKPTESESISSNEWLETRLIGAALAVNPDLRNISKTQKQKTVVVDGFLNDPDSLSDKAAKSLRKILKVH